MGPQKRCEVCKDATSKYKCPTCLSPYCSLSCYKKHKETPCSNLVAPVDERPSPSPAPSPALLLQKQRPFQVDEASLMLHKRKLESIVASDEVREALKDEKLQKLIYSIDSATNSENEVDKAMETEDFRKLSEKILSIIGMQ